MDLVDRVHGNMNSSSHILSFTVRTLPDFRAPKMSNSTRKLDHVDTASTARIDRRQTVLAQIEAALLADKISVLEVKQEATGSDPYNNSYRPAANAWSRQAR
jgi:hypothetical protein